MPLSDSSRGQRFALGLDALQQLLPGDPALAHAVLREDADFHTYQMLEAGVRQYREWGESDEGRHILIAVARYLAAHSPTERAQLQTAMVARRLSRGETLHETEADP